MSSNTIFYGHGLPSIPKHQVNNDMIIKNKDELNETISKIDEPVIVLNVYDIQSRE